MYIGEKMFFKEVEEAQPDPIFGLNESFIKDVREKKVSLLVGIYQDEHLRAEIFHSAKKAKEQIFSQDLAANYLPIDGLKEMVELIGPVLFGENWEKDHGRIYGAHTVGGTGALRVGAEFFHQFVSKKVALPNRTWPNHRAIFEKAGCELEAYPYYNQEKKAFDFEGTLDFLKNLPKKTVVVLHACCHNPTGCDPTIDEWKAISRVMKEKELLPFFDCAYQGLGDGVQKDAEAVRLFVNDGHEMAVAYSCSKNFSMYCQRVGVLFMIGSDSAVKHRVGSQVKRIIRTLYSNPPSHGARIVAEILKQDDLRKLWLKDLEMIRHRINLMRETFVQRLISNAKDMDFGYLKKHKGMFSFVDLDKSEVQMLIDRFGVYLTGSGRINVSGLTTKNIDYVVNSIVSVLKADVRS